jgi:D-3-phosphoglycerate dehydrogenase
MTKILVTPRSFGKHSDDAMNLLESKGFEVTLNPYGRILTEEEMIKEIEDVEGIIVGVDPLNAEVLSHAKNLKAISKYGVGTDNIDLNYCKEHNIPVTITNNANSDSVADFAFTLMLAVARRVVEVDKACRQSDWGKKTSIGVYQKTIGVVGTGAIGKGVIRRAKGFDMKVLAYDLYKDEVFAEENGVEYVELDQLLKQSDFISLHLPATKETQNLIDKEALDMMKETAVLVNTARGDLVDEDALFDALKSKKIWGAGLDVFKQEPPANKELLELDNIVVGAHSAASTVDAVDKMSEIAAVNILKNL